MLNFQTLGAVLAKLLKAMIYLEIPICFGPIAKPSTLPDE
jgi:hypothetical protein